MTPPAFQRFLDSWTYRPVDVVSFWAAVFWTVNLLPDPMPVARVHVVMASLVPLWAWGAVAGTVALVHLISIHLPRAQIPRYAALFIGGGFWTCVAVLFWSSGASITGKGVYLTLACITLWHAWQVRHAR